MKLLTKKIILLISIVVIGMNGYANTPLPQPTATTTQTNEITPPETPVNKNLIVLTLTGTLLGLYTIRKHKTKQKKTLN